MTAFQQDDNKCNGSTTPRALVQVSDEDYEAALSALKELSNKKAEARKGKDSLKYSTYCWVQSLSKVNSVNQTFQCDFELWFHRQLSKIETIEYYNDPLNFEAYIPTVFAVGAQETISKELIKWPNNKNFMIEYYEDWDCMTSWTLFMFNIVFTEDLELENFPFDIQHFDIRLQIDWRDMSWDKTLIKGHNEIFDIDYSHCTFSVPNYATSLIGWNFEDNVCLQIIGNKYTENIDTPWAHVSHVFTLKRECCNNIKYYIIIDKFCFCIW